MELEGRFGLLGAIQSEFKIADETWPLDIYVRQRQEPVSCYLGIDFMQNMEWNFG